MVGTRIVYEHRNCDFHEALVLSCGVDIELAKEITRQGIEDAEDLASTSEEELNRMFKLFQKHTSSFLPKDLFSQYKMPDEDNFVPSMVPQTEYL